MNVISKISTTQPTATQKANEPASPVSSPPSNRNQNAGAPSSLTTSVLSVPGTMDTSTMGLSEGQLKRQGLDCLIAVLRSLVAWGTAPGKAADDTVHSPKPQPGEEIRREPVTPEASYDRLSAAGTSAETLRQPTPDLVDDPSKFESAKQKKTTLLEGVKKFNFKPKRVCLLLCLKNQSILSDFQGIQFLIETGFIASKAPPDIATFLLTTDGLSKAMIGEYLGDG